MTLSDFNYHYLFQDRLALATYSMFVITIVSFYWFKHAFLRGVFVFILLLLALYAGRLEWMTIPGALLMGAAFYYGLNGHRKVWRGICFAIALLFASAVSLLHLPGIHNWQVLEKLALSPNAIPYSMYFNLDKSSIGLFFIWFSVYSLANGGRWQPVMKKSGQVAVLAILALMPLSLYLGYVTFDLKLTPLFFLWAVHNLFFTCFAEEALFRGMIQRFLQFRLQNIRYGKWIAIVIAALLFGAAHYAGGLRYVLLATVAGVFYGYAFMKTEKIEASIAVHFLVNSVHFIFFTYPALKTAF